VNSKSVFIFIAIHLNYHEVSAIFLLLYEVFCDDGDDAAVPLLLSLMVLIIIIN
jgi:hypothetical protein